MHIKPFKLRPSLRRRRRYSHGVIKWEKQWQQGKIDDLQLQRAYDSTRAILLPADDKPFRKRCLQNGDKVDA